MIILFSTVETIMIRVSTLTVAVKAGAIRMQRQKYGDIVIRRVANKTLVNEILISCDFYSLYNDKIRR